MAGKYIDSASNLFDTMDKTGNGSLHRIEFLEGLRSLNLALTETQINDMFDSIDKDSDNAIEKIEFVKLIEGPPKTTKEEEDVPRIQFETSPESTPHLEDSELEFWNKMKTVITHTPSMMHDKFSIESAKKLYSVSKLVQKRTIGSDKSVIEGLLSRTVHNEKNSDLGGVDEMLIRKYLRVLSTVSRHRLDSQRKLSEEEIRVMKISARRHMKQYESKKKAKKKMNRKEKKQREAIHTASSLFLPSSCSQEEDYLQSFVESSDSNVTIKLIENIVRSREKARIEEEARARLDNKSMSHDMKKSTKMKMKGMFENVNTRNTLK